jgi:hypothetical protein
LGIDGILGVVQREENGLNFRGRVVEGESGEIDERMEGRGKWEKQEENCQNQHFHLCHNFSSF